jgi:HEAT repeat protein
MGGLEIALLAAGFVAVAVFSSVSVHFAQKRSARQSSPPAAAVPELEARLQPPDVPLKVRVEADSGADGAGTLIVVEGVCDGLVLFREVPGAAPGSPGVGESAGPLWTTPELEVGDAEFDRTFRVLGPQPLVLALLDGETRRLLRALALNQMGEISVGRRALRVDVPLSHRLHPKAVEDRGHAAVAIARRLVPPVDVAQRMAANATRDPVPAVRLRNLLAVAREKPDHPATRAALKAGLADRDMEVRLRAALALGREGREALLAMADAPHTTDVHREAAIRGLGGEVPQELLVRVLRRCVRSGARPGPPDEPRSARACIAALGGCRTPEAVSTLQALLLGNAFLAADAGRALGRIGGGDAEAALIGALDGEVFESRLAAAEALGEAGSAAAVPALREAERHGVEIRRRARQAIEQIQARVQAAPGAVSLAGGEAGQVSIAADASGRVSLPPRERGGGR